jgi:hypothetical protein
MKNRTAILSVVLSLGLSIALTGQAMAQSEESPTPSPTDQCTELYKGIPHWALHRRPANRGDCFMSVLPVGSGILYRSYLFTRGSLMVFNSYDDSVPSSSGSGARLFYFFPRNQTPNIEVAGDLAQVKSSFNGIGFEINSKDNTSGFTGITAKVDSAVNATNAGGVEILSSPTLWLDIGFSEGHDPSVERNRTAVFHDVNGKTCKVKNSEIFDYYSDGDDAIKYSDADLKIFLAQRCPSLTVNY